MYPDPTVIRRLGGTEVYRRHQLVTWPDGTTLALHPLRMNGADDQWRRAVFLDGGLCLVFDLRRICPPLREDIMQTPGRDHTGCIDYRLREAFRTCDEVLVRVANAAEMAIAPAPDHVGTLQQAVAA